MVIISVASLIFGDVIADVAVIGGIPARSLDGVALAELAVIGGDDAGVSDSANISASHGGVVKGVVCYDFLIGGDGLVSHDFCLLFGVLLIGGFAIVPSL